MFDKGKDIAEWGAGEQKGFNPNDYTKTAFADKEKRRIDAGKGLADMADEKK